MECQNIKDKLGAFFDGELTGAEREQVEHHLTGCPACQEELMVLRRLNKVSCEMQVFEPDEAYWANLPNRITSQLTTRPAATLLESIRAISRNWGMMFRLAGAMATAVIIFVVARNVMMPDREMTPKTVNFLAEDISLSAQKDDSSNFGDEILVEKPTTQPKKPVERMGRGQSSESDYETAKKLIAESNQLKQTRDSEAARTQLFENDQPRSSTARAGAVGGLSLSEPAAKVISPQPQKEFIGVQTLDKGQIPSGIQETDARADNSILLSEGELQMKMSDKTGKDITSNFAHLNKMQPASIPVPALPDLQEKSLQFEVTQCDVPGPTLEDRKKAADTITAEYAAYNLPPDRDIGMMTFDTPPRPIGGLEAIQKNLKYSDKGKKECSDTNVILKVLIDEKGDVVKAEIFTSIGNTECDTLAINAIKSAKWEPAVKNDKPVSGWITIPVHFVVK